jgi:membrane associated rhomboid family serine protease
MLSNLNPFANSGTHDTVKRILIATAVVSLLLALWDSLVSIPFQLPLLSSFFTLSAYGISKFYLWQFVSYLFVLDTAGMTIHLMYLISSLITLYLVWIFGSAVYDHAGRKQFLQLYFLSGIVSGFLAILMMWMVGINDTLSGPTAPLLSLFTAWTFLYPEVELMLFFVVPIRSKWLFAGTLGILFLLTFGQFDLIYFVFYLSAVVIGYLYSTMIWEIGSPFEYTYDFDRALIARGKWIRDYQGVSNSVRTTKIVDISTGDALKDDEDFVDAMLQKISKQGQSALTWAERKRLDEISKRKTKSND